MITDSPCSFPALLPYFSISASRENQRPSAQPFNPRRYFFSHLGISILKGRASRVPLPPRGNDQLLALRSCALIGFRLLDAVRVGVFVYLYITITAIHVLILLWLVFSSLFLFSFVVEKDTKCSYLKEFYWQLDIQSVSSTKEHIFVFICVRNVWNTRFLVLFEFVKLCSMEHFISMIPNRQIHFSLESAESRSSETKCSNRVSRVFRLKARSRLNVPLWPPLLPAAKEGEQKLRNIFWTIRSEKFAAIYRTRTHTAVLAESHQRGVERPIKLSQ